jgi:hypothetical protein
MSVPNPLWGAPRIHDELLKLGIDVVAKYVASRAGGPLFTITRRRRAAGHAATVGRGAALDSAETAPSMMMPRRSPPHFLSYYA